MRNQTILCRPGDPRCGKVWDEAGGFEQTAGGPLLIVIGSETTNTKCVQLAERHQLDPEELIRFRDTHVPAHASGLSG